MKKQPTDPDSESQLPAESPVCPGCGYPVESGLNFCPSCGAAVNVSPNEPESIAQASPRRKKRKRAVLLLLFIAAAGALAAAYFLFIGTYIQYADASHLMSNGDYAAAGEKLAALWTYRDSAERFEDCVDGLLAQGDYACAYNLIAGGVPADEAAELKRMVTFRWLGNYITTHGNMGDITYYNTSNYTINIPVEDYESGFDKTLQLSCSETCYDREDEPSHIDYGGVFFVLHTVSQFSNAYYGTFIYDVIQTFYMTSNYDSYTFTYTQNLNQFSGYSVEHYSASMIGTVDSKTYTRNTALTSDDTETSDGSALDTDSLLEGMRDDVNYMLDSLTSLMHDNDFPGSVADLGFSSF